MYTWGLNTASDGIHSDAILSTERGLSSLCIIPITRYRLWHETCTGETAWLRCSAGTGPWGWPQLLYQLDADNTITCCQTHTQTTHPINGAVSVTGVWFDMGPAAAQRASSYTTLTSHERHDVSNHQQHGCLFNSLFKWSRKNKSKLNMWRVPLEIQRPFVPFYSDLVGSHFECPPFSASRRSFFAPQN